MHMMAAEMAFTTPTTTMPRQARDSGVDDNMVVVLDDDTDTPLSAMTNMSAAAYQRMVAVTHVVAVALHDNSEGDDNDNTIHEHTDINTW